MSADNYVQDPLFTQNYNRYSYAYNNPLVYNDPDGQWLNFVIGAALGGFSGWRIGKAQGATGWNLAGYIFAGAAIGTLTAGIGDAVVSSFSWVAQSGVSIGGSIAAYGTAGAVSGAVSGASFAALAGANIGEGLWKGALFGGVTGAAGGYFQHLRFEKSTFDSDRYSAQFEDGPIAKEIGLNEVIVKGKRESDRAQLIPVPNFLPRVFPMPPFPVVRDRTYHGNDMRNPNYHYVYMIFRHSTSNPMAYTFGEEEVDYAVQKYGIGQVWDGGARVIKQVNTLNRVSLKGVTYDYVIKNTMIPGNSMARFWEKFYVYTFAVRHGYKPPLNLRP